MEDTMDALERAKNLYLNAQAKHGTKNICLENLIALGTLAAQIAIAERLGRLISLKETQTGYGPLEVFEPDNPIPSVEDLEYRDDIPY